MASKTTESGSDLGTIRGRVVSDTGKPLQGVRVQAELQTDAAEDPSMPEALSDTQGRFTLPGCKRTGKYELKAVLDGWWQLSTVLRRTGATDTELVLQRGGGIRGQVIEALDSSVEEYIVVVRYEHPPFEWNPESQVRLQRSIERGMREMMHQEESNRMHTQVLMQELGIKSKPEQRPDGHAWARLEPDGRFEFRDLRPGKWSVIISARNRTRGLATIASVEVLSGVVGQDSRLNPVRMNEHACVYRMAITDQEGVAIPAGAIDVLPDETDGHGRFSIEFKDGVVLFVGPLWIDQLTATAKGYVPLEIRGPRQSIRAELQAQ